MKPEFSFNYGEKRCVFSAENNALYELEGGITIQAEARTYPKYDAVRVLLDQRNELLSDA